MEYRLETLVHAARNALVLLNAYAGKLANTAFVSLLNLICDSFHLLTLCCEDIQRIGYLKHLNKVVRILLVRFVA